MNIKLGGKIKYLRNTQNMTQQALATILGVTKSVISAYENDIRQPSYDVLIKIATTFHVSTDYLLNCPEGNHSIDLTGLRQNEIDGIILLVASLKKASD